MSIYDQVNNQVLPRPVELGQYTSIAYTERLDDLGIDPSVGSKGDAYDNAMAEAWVATYKTELVHGRRFPSFEHAEHETLAWIGFYNDDRLHENLGDIPPAECADDYHRSNYKKGNIKTLTKTEPPGNPASRSARVNFHWNGVAICS